MRNGTIGIGRRQRLQELVFQTQKRFLNLVFPNPNLVLISPTKCFSNVKLACGVKAKIRS